jgi:hypothetical protein
MSNERRHLRFLITSALLIGPALGCGSAETDGGTTVVLERPPTGNPVGPEPEPIAVEEVVVPEAENRPTMNPMPTLQER